MLNVVDEFTRESLAIGPPQVELIDVIELFIQGGVPGHIATSPSSSPKGADVDRGGRPEDDVHRAGYSGENGFVESFQRPAPSPREAQIVSESWCCMTMHSAHTRRSAIMTSGCRDLSPVKQTSSTPCVRTPLFVSALMRTLGVVHSRVRRPHQKCECFAVGRIRRCPDAGGKTPWHVLNQERL